MPALLPGELIPWIEQRFFTADGAPLIAGHVWTYAAGTSTPQATYTDVDLLVGTEHTNPIILDGAGRPEDGPIYLQATGYKFIVTDADDVEQYSIDDVENVGAVFAANFGIVLGEGARNVVSGYQVLATDRLVTVDSTGGPDPCVIQLLAVADATQPLTIKNLGDTDLAVTANGADLIDANSAIYVVPAAVNPMAPSILLVPSPPSDWYILASHGIV